MSREEAFFRSFFELLDSNAKRFYMSLGPRFQQALVFERSLKRFLATGDEAQLHAGVLTAPR